MFFFFLKKKIAKGTSYSALLSFSTWTPYYSSAALAIETGLQGRISGAILRIPVNMVEYSSYIYSLRNFILLCRLFHFVIICCFNFTTFICWFCIVIVTKFTGLQTCCSEIFLFKLFSWHFEFFSGWRNIKILLCFSEFY